VKPNSTFPIAVSWNEGKAFLDSIRRMSQTSMPSMKVDPSTIRDNPKKAAQELALSLPL
jgi:hypothetical protein